MKASIFALTTLLWAGPAFAGPCRPSKPASTSTSVAAVSSSPAPPSSSGPPQVTQIVGTPASSSVPASYSSAPVVVSSSSSVPVVVSSSSSVPVAVIPSSSSSSSSAPVVIPSSSSVPVVVSSSSSSVPAVVSSPPASSSSSPAPSSFSSPAPSTFSSVTKSSSSAAPTSSAPVTSNPGVPSCSTDNLFVDSDLSLGLSYWPSDILSGSPTFKLSASCGTSTSGAAYNACLELDLVTLGKAEGIDFHQTVTVVKGTSYTGYFYYRLPALGASGQSMATLTCTMNGATKFSVVLCDDDVSQTWKKASFTYAADCTEAEFMCKVTTSAVTAQLQFTDFYLGAQC
ncbi:hypothetical protein SCUCBS95973_007237 [Sporothrix curviconia]|uniref:CBM-cenC domain-containing protein n=1 Tax=Sporothrix curviconia TaxID=1260050 RepID=A0ABP0CC41_9PEZI